MALTYISQTAPVSPNRGTKFYDCPIFLLKKEQQQLVISVFITVSSYIQEL